MFAGNAPGATSPAYTAIVDYVFNTASPVVPQDTTINLVLSGTGNVVKNPDQNVYFLRQQVELTAIPTTGWNFEG